MAARSSRRARPVPAERKRPFEAGQRLLDRGEPIARQQQLAAHAVQLRL